MKRRPVLYLALILVALLADDVEFIVQLPVAVGVRASVAIHADSPTPLSALRLVDGAGAALQLVRSGRLLRDSASGSFAERQMPLDLVHPGAVENAGQASPPLSSLVSEHTRLQI